MRSLILFVINQLVRSLRDFIQNPTPKWTLMRRSLGRFKISGVLITICTGSFKNSFRKFWIWARTFVLLGGPLLIG